jgi:hypothetical protein
MVGAAGRRPAVVKPVARTDQNFVYHGPSEDIGDLPCRVDGAQTTSHWRPSEEELAVLNDGGLVELTVIGHPMQPVAVNVDAGELPEAEAPFKRGADGSW